MLLCVHYGVLQGVIKHPHHSFSAHAVFEFDEFEFEFSFENGVNSSDNFVYAFMKQRNE